MLTSTEISKLSLLSDYEQSLKRKKNLKSSEWTLGSMPSFAGKKALVLPGAFYGSGVELMAKAGFGKAESVEDADVVVFMGGVDLDPSTYGEKAIPETSGSRHRDEAERVVYEIAKAAGKVCFGICRGAQFLHAMNNGKMWQHVNNHAGGDHIIYDLDGDVTVEANSYHHQMLIDHENLEIVAVCRDQVSKVFKADGLTIDLRKEGENQLAEMEIEAGAYNDTKCFFVQGHPEVGSPEYASWCMHKLKDYITDWEAEGLTRDKHGQLSPAGARQPPEMSVNAQIDMWRKAGGHAVDLRVVQ